MEVDSRSRSSKYPPNASNLEVLERSNCLLAFCVIAAIVLFAICLGIWVTNETMAGFALYVFWVCGVALFVCLCVIGWQARLLLHEDRERIKNQKILDQRIAANARMLKMAETADKERDSVKFRVTNNDLSLDIIRSAMNTRQQSRIVDSRLEQTGVVEAGRAAMPLAPGQPSTRKAPALILPRKLVTPPGFDLMEAIRHFPLAPDNVFLGRGHRRDFACDPRIDLCHGAFNAASGRGKTITVKGIESQVLKVGHEVIHADIKYMLIDEKGNDYRPIARALMAQGDINMGGKQLPHLLMREDHIVYMIEWLVYYELRRRMAMAARGDHSYSVLYVFLEELQYLVATYKHLGQIIPRLLIVGRSLGIKIFCVAQSFQVQNLKLNSGMRENFESAWFLGGDDHSAAALLDLTLNELKAMIAENHIALGKGVTLFRNNVFCYEADILRAGMASNDFVYWLFGRADDFMLPDDVLPQFGEDDAEYSQVENVKERRSQTRVTGPLKETSHIAPVKKAAGKKPTLTNAVEVWNTFPYGIGRTRLMEELQARGFECSDDLVRKFLKDIKRQLNDEQGSSDGKGVAQEHER